MASKKFLTELFVKMAQMMGDPMAMGGMPPGGAPMGPPMGPPPLPPGMPPVDPMAGMMPPMDPAAMGGAPAIDPNMIASLLQQGPAPEGGEAGEKVTDKEIASKAIDVAQSAMEFALAQNSDNTAGATDAAAGSLLASGALEGVSPEEILSLNQESPPPAPIPPELEDKIAAFCGGGKAPARPRVQPKPAPSVKPKTKPTKKPDWA